MKTEIVIWREGPLTSKARKLTLVAESEPQAQLLAAIACRMNKLPMTRVGADLLKIFGDVPESLIAADVPAKAKGR